jgi:hypothetical protein
MCINTLNTAGIQNNVGLLHTENILECMFLYNTMVDEFGIDVLSFIQQKLCIYFIMLTMLAKTLQCIMFNYVCLLQL